MREPRRTKQGGLVVAEKVVGLINFKALFGVFVFLLSFFTGLVTWVIRVSEEVTFLVDAGKPGAVIGNKVSNVNLWSVDGINSATVPDAQNDVTAFVEYIQLMQATGGNAQRDLFRDPLNRAVLDDYDFSTLIDACRGILNLGAKPHIKTGNVPLKLTTDPQIGVFGVNVNPPDSYEQYYTYIRAVADALVAEFGTAEVRNWRFGVMTEYENADWFKTKSGDARETLEAFCRLYDYTVAALQEAVGPEVFVGAHSMSVAEGLWDERAFIDHCADGINAKTGARGTRLCFLNASFYDSKPGKFGDKTLPETIALLRDKAESVGLNNLEYGIDEGRILSGTRGSVAADLALRICGFTYQAAYDARLIKQMADHDIDYFSSWGYLTGGLWSGLPSVSFHVADRFAAMAHAARVPVKAKGGLIPGAEIDALAGVDGDTVYLMAYNFKNKVDYRRSAAMTFRVSIPGVGNESVKVTRWVVDDDANFFDEWQADRKTHAITDDCFVWSPDDPSVDTLTTLNAPWARDLYFRELRPVYEEKSRLLPVTEVLQAENGVVTLRVTAAPNAVVFYEVETVN